MHSDDNASNRNLDSTIFHEDGNGKIDLDMSSSSQSDILKEWMSFNTFEVRGTQFSFSLLTFTLPVSI